jgi:ketosteroid isomerase-like protein
LTPTRTAQVDIDELAQLNADYLSSDQNSDTERYEEILADDFTATLMDFTLRDRTSFLEMIAAGRPFTDLKADNVIIRLLGDFALIHAHITFNSLDGQPREGAYTDTWARRGGKWLAIAANVSAQPA